MVNEWEVIVLYPIGFGDGLQVSIAEYGVMVCGYALLSVGVQKIEIWVKEDIPVEFFSV